MAVSVIVPKLAADEAGAMLTEWYCQEGEQVVAGQPLCRLERDFVACEVEAEEGGVLSYAVGVGDAPAPGDVLAYLAPSADGSVGAAEGQPATLASSEAPRQQAAPEHEPDATAGAWLSSGTRDGEAGLVWPSEREAEPAPEVDGDRWGLTEEQFVAEEIAFWPNTEAEPEDAPEAAAVEFEVQATEPAWGADADAEDGAAEDQMSPFAGDDAAEVDDASPEAKPAAIASMPAADLAIEEPARRVAAEATAGGGAEREPAEPLPPQPITLRIEIEATEDTSRMTNLVFEAIVVAAAEHVDASACVVQDMRAGAAQPASDEWAVLASYEGTGVVEATSRLEAGKPFSFALADRRSAPAFHEHGLSARHTMALALTYDGTWWSDEEGLRLLAEVGESLARPTAEAA